MTTESWPVLAVLLFCDLSSLVGLCMQDYKCLYAEVTIWLTQR